MSDTSSPDTTPDATAPVAGTSDAAVAPVSTSEKLEKGNRRFTLWRKQRAFGAGLLMLLGGIVIITPAYLSFSISNIQIQIATLGGVSTLVIGILLIVCGLMTWFRGEGRILTGVASMVLAIVALPQSNLGGFIVGTMLALLGGALALAWTPQSKEEARAEKTERKQSKHNKKPHAGASAAAVLAAITGLAVGMSSHSPQAAAQLPGLPEIHLPTLPGLPGNDGGENGGTMPTFPTLPTLPAIPAPHELDGNDLQGLIDNGLDALDVEIPGLNVAPPAPISGLLPVSGSTFTIKADRTALTPNMKLSVVTLDTVQGTRKAFRIDSDAAVMTNLRVQFPGAVPGAQELGQDTRNDISKLTGNFHIFIKKMTITAELMGVDTMIPITLDADWAPDMMVNELKKLGIGLPDFLSGKTDILNGTMETYMVAADKATFPTTVIGPWA